MDDLNYFLRCGECGHEAMATEYGSAGACDGSCFCPECDAEVELETGRTALLCGKCDACQSLMVEGVWGSTQDHRERLRESHECHGDL